MAWRATRMLALPWHLAAVATTARGFEHNPVLASPWLNRKGLHVRRVALAQRIAAARRERLRHLLPWEEAERFARDGILILPRFLEAEAFRRLRREIFGTPLPAREQLQGNALNRLTALSPEVLRHLPETRALIHSPAWRGRLDHVTSQRRTPLTFVQTIFSGHGDGAEDPQTHLHSDTFYPSMKAWLYLQDVPAEDGPFVYVPGSHLATAARLDWEREVSLMGSSAPDPDTRRGSPRVTEGELARLGYGPPKVCAVPANTLVIADTYGFHARARAARPSARVSLFAQGRCNPFLPLGRVSPFNLPVLRDREASAYWSLSDRLAEWGIRGQPWPLVGTLRATEKR